MKSAKIFILYTGGTIGMVSESPDAASEKPPLIPQPLHKILPYIPMFDGVDSAKIEQGQPIECHEGDIQGSVSIGSMEHLIDSSQATPEDWQAMIHAITQRYHQYDAFVILHGTDTLAYTSAAFSLVFDQHAKPIIFTGSQLPLDVTHTDAKVNLQHAIRVALVATQQLRGVLVVFGQKIYRGGCITKVSTTSFVAYCSPHHPEVGTVDEHIYLPTTNAPTADILNNEPPTHTQFNPNIHVLWCYPGLDIKHIQALAATQPDGVLVATYGSGNVGFTVEMIDVFQQLIDKGCIVMAVTQCLQGEVVPNQYQTGINVCLPEVIHGGHVTTETAVAKLMWVLGNYPQQAHEVLNR